MSVEIFNENLFLGLGPGSSSNINSTIAIRHDEVPSHDFLFFCIYM